MAIELDIREDGRPARPGSLTLTPLQKAIGVAKQGIRADINSMASFGKANAPVAHNALDYQATPADVELMLLAVALGQGASVRRADNTLQAMNLAEVTALLADVLAQRQAWNNAQAALLNELASLTEPSEIRAFDSIRGWPGGF